MSAILHIESATDVCSVALADSGKLIAKKEKREGRSHAVVLTVFIDELLRETGIIPRAVAVSMGPGSYTGLRIGVSVAKGYCYGLGIPLIAIPTLQSMSRGFLATHRDLPDNALLAPVIDARRMEVYTALYTVTGEEVEPTSARIIDDQVFRELPGEQPIFIFGDGAFKFKKEPRHPNLTISDTYVISAEHLIALAYQKYSDNEFVDLAYFEPFYLKDFVTTTPRNKNIF